jgi:hypothetical protein
MNPDRRETFPPRVVYCESAWCNHSAVVNPDFLPDETTVRMAMRQ